MSERMKLIEDRLRAALTPEHLELIDESAKHVGHEGAKGGGGHYALTIVSRQFAGKSPIERHRMVYAALGDAMRGAVHALSVRALTPDEI